MPISILWRLILGYGAMLLFSVTISSHSIAQLERLSRSAYGALDRENRLLGYQEQLADTFLSEVRYADKLIITQATPLREQLNQFKADYMRYLEEMKTLTDSGDLKARIERVEELHAWYHELLEQELRYIKGGQAYAQTRYREEKERLLDAILGELVSLKSDLQDELQKKLGAVAGAAYSARNLAIAFTVALLALGLALSFLISRSIVGPLGEMKRAVENNDSALSELPRWSDVPEIHDLARTLQDARSRLQDVARSQAAFAGAIRNRHLTHLVSVRKRLGYLKEEAGARLTDQQVNQIDTLSAEIERLIADCSSLPAPPAGPMVGAMSVLPKATMAAPALASKIRFMSARARDWPIAFWNGLRASAPSGIWKGEKR